jgi:hypothetical protein
MREIIMYASEGWGGMPPPKCDGSVGFGREIDNDF